MPQNKPEPVDRERADPERVSHTVTFTRPYEVRVTAQPLPPPDRSNVMVKTTYSAVSTGTELLAYTGKMPKSIPTDAVFAGHSEPFSYPCIYGYAAVGIVSSAPPDSPVQPGQRVFAFREHTTLFSSPATALLPVPADVTLLDAAFFPHVETAVCLAADIAPLPGEVVAVVGQGVIGLLLAAVLCKAHPYTCVVALDTRADRRALSPAYAALDPAAPEFSTKFAEVAGVDGADVSIDVTGAGTGLDTAIRVTRDHGRVVIGSWYGEKDVTLTSLGGRFHRSHMSLVASQVSCIPPHLAGRWSKARRNALAWTFVRDLRPSELFPVRMVDVREAPEAYEQLAAGEYLQVVFRYT